MSFVEAVAASKPNGRRTLFRVAREVIALPWTNPVGILFVVEFRIRFLAVAELMSPSVVLSKSLKHLVIGHFDSVLGALSGIQGSHTDRLQIWVN